MRLVDPSTIDVSTETRGSLNDLRPLMHEIDLGRPFDEASLQQIHREIAAQSVYHSTSIEGNTLNWRETVAVLSGIVVAGKHREAQEVTNLGRAFEYLRKLLADPRELCEVEVRSLHRMVMEGLSEEAGSYRTGGVAIAGASIQPPEHVEVPRLVADMCRLYNQYSDQLDPVILAAWLHHATAAIHPFSDGNGRTARCLQDYALFAHRYVPCVVRKDDSDDYYRALADADQGNYDPLVSLVCNRIVHVADKYLSVIRNEAEFEDWARQIAGQQRQREEDAARAEYLEWRRQMEHLRFQFQIASAKLNEFDLGVSTQVREFDTIELQRWQNLRDVGRAERTWFFKVSFDHRNTREYAEYTFWFARHYWRDIDDECLRRRQRVSLLISERDPQSPKGYEYVNLDDTDEALVSLRELMFVESVGLVKRWRDPAIGSDRYERGADPAKVARDFMGEVLRNRFRVG